MKTFEPPRTLEMGGDGNGLYPPGMKKVAPKSTEPYSESHLNFWGRLKL